jgi:hypothetical protein
MEGLLGLHVHAENPLLLLGNAITQLEWSSRDWIRNGVDHAQINYSDNLQAT